MPLSLPSNHKIAVSLGVDFDAHSVWPGSYGVNSPGYLSRGEFGAEVGAPRLLKLFKTYDIRTTWFTPTHTMETFPASFNAVMAHGHEIGAHGCLHEKIGALEESVERALLVQEYLYPWPVVSTTKLPWCVKLHASLSAARLFEFLEGDWHRRPRGTALLCDFDGHDLAFSRDYVAKLVNLVRDCVCFAKE